ncbi:MAG: lipopolysaccharide biosynthesis protein, partial [Rhodocyclaceae bacterium]|nr:lipopolysaccharide biosynthesis protein [Rhodocyclaceae bacterium]
MSLRQRSTSAAYWSALESAARTGVQFVISLILARLLTPADFGAVAMLALFVSLALIFVDSGFGAALIQRQDVTEEDKASVFWFNMAAAVLVAGALAASAGWIAEFYRLPILEPLTYAMAVNVVLTALGSLQASMMTKDLDFRTQARITVVASLVSGGLGVGMAFGGFGVWSLIAQTLASSAITSALLWYWRPWRPAAGVSMASLRRLFGFGAYLLAAATIDAIYHRLNTLLIGRLYSASDLGFFNRADHLQEMPTSLLSRVLNRVAFPVFSAANKEPDLLRRGVRKAILLLMLVNLPLMAGMAYVADWLVVVLYGDQWAPTGPLLTILCLAGLLWPLHVINLSVLKAQGRSDLFLWVSIAKKVIGVTALVLAAPHGLAVIAWAVVGV